MKNIEASVEISRDQSKLLISVSVTMPIWVKENDDNIFSVDAPLLGIKLFVENETDIQGVLDDSIKSFCFLSEKFGQGLEKELQDIGWEKAVLDDRKAEVTLDFSTNKERNFVFDSIIKTGDSYTTKLLAVA